MSNPYLSFINSIGGSTGSHSTLQKLAASSSPSTSSVTTTTTTSTVSTNSSRTHASSSRPTTAPRLQEKPTTSFSSASKDNRHGSSSYSHSHSNSYSNSHSNSHSYSRPSTSASKPRSSSSHHHSSSYSNGSQSRDYKSSSSSNGNSNNYSSNNHSSSRNHDRTDSKNYGHDQDRRHSNGSKSHVSSRDTINHRDERDDGDGRNGSGNYHAGSRNERKRERDVDTGRSDDPRGYARTSKDKDASFSEPRAKKRHTRSRSRTPSRTRSRSTSRSRSRGPSRTGTKYRERSYSPRRRPTIKSRSKSKSRSRSRSRSRSPSPMTLVKDSKPTAPPAPIPSLVPMLPQPKSPSPPAPLPVTTPIRTITPPPPPPPPQQQQRSYLDLDDTSSFSTLSSPSSYSLSPPPISVPSSPAKDLSPIKKRRMESLLQAEASYSSPSSLSSLSPEPSDHSSSERELEEGEMSPLPAKEEGTNTTAQDRPKRATKEPPKKESPSQQALELELFGKIISKPKINSTTIATAANTTSTKKAEASSRLSSINGGKQDSNLERKPTSTSSITKVKPVEYTDEEEYGSLGSIVKDEPSLNNRSNGHLGANGKRSSLDNVRTSREILTINTQKGTVTSKTVKIPQKPPKPSNGTAIQRPSKSSSSVNTSKESSQKHSSSSAVGAASRRMSILHSDQIVAAAMGRYKNHFHMLVEDSDSTVASNPSSTGGDSMHVSLEYPGKDSREKFTLMKPFLSRSKTESDDKDEYNPIDDLVQTVRIIMEHFFTPEQYKELFGTASEGLHRSLTKYKTRKDGAQFLKAVEEFNQIMRKQKSLGAIQEYVRQYGHRLPYDLVVHILQQVYSRTVAARASKLNQYEAFSNNVYGEILPILTKEFIQRTKMDESKVFVDLGCGIGNVVLQVALQTGAESYGVEIMDTPAKFAKKQAREFEARTRAFGLNHGAVSMIHGDFLDTPGLAGILARADVVLVNNYAFNSALNQSLLQLFLDLKEGCKIISLKTFVSLDHKINVRNAGSVESILRVKKYPYYTNAVSWTHNGGEYFIATVDRSAVQAFWERAMTNGGTSLDDGGSRRSSTRRR